MTAKRKGRSRSVWRSRRKHIGTAPPQLNLYRTTDHGRPISIPLEHLGARGGRHSGGWEPILESFLKLNDLAIRSLCLEPKLTAGANGARLELRPQGTAGAVPFVSPITGQVEGGLLVEPRFGWSGVGPVLQETGWAASPDFVDLPLVPGSGREVPAWVLAGPVLARLETLIRELHPGYEHREELRQSPRGTLLWPTYLRRCLPVGRWHHLPCRFPDLQTDPKLRQAVRWTLERIRRDLTLTGGTDRIASSLAHLALQLIDLVRDVSPVMPTRDQLGRQWGRGPFHGPAMRNGVQAMGWIVDERGLGGGRQLHGLSWKLALATLWEHYVESLYRHEAAMTGGDVRTGRQRQTVVPINWSDPMHRSLGHLIPDLVIRRGRSVQVVDAKYKAHFAELDVAGWHALAEDFRASHRTDVHQVLAYAGVMDANEVAATLVYPLRRETWVALRDRGRDRSMATVYAGDRAVRLELRGVPFGGAALPAGRFMSSGL